jgi:hypothetical protein
MLKQGIVICVIFLFMLVSLPIASGEHHFYPKEEGPYTVTAIGPSNGMGGGFATLFRLLPLWLLLYPLDIGWHFDSGSVFFVNGEKQDIVYPADIALYGFKGYGPTIYMYLLKENVMIFLHRITGERLTPRARVVGLCTEIIVDDAR